MPRTYPLSIHLHDLKQVKQTLLNQQEELQMRIINVQRQIDAIIPPIVLEPIGTGYSCRIGKETYLILKDLDGYILQGPGIERDFALLSQVKEELNKLQERIC